MTDGGRRSTTATPDTHGGCCSPAQQPPSTSTTSSALQQPHSRIANWIMDSGALDLVSRELALVQQNLVQLNMILEQIEQLPVGSEHSEVSIILAVLFYFSKIIIIKK